MTKCHKCLSEILLKLLRLTSETLGSTCVHDNKSLTISKLPFSMAIINTGLSNYLFKYY